MNTKTFLLYSNVKNSIQTDIRCIVNSNGSFGGKGKIIHINKSNIKKYPVNNKQRRDRYKLNKERKMRLLKDLDDQKIIEKEKIKALEHTKKMEADMKRYNLMTEEIDMDSELEDMESYI